MLAPERSLRVAFCHPDLGLGGAERLVVDAAAELARRGHVVDIYTAHFDPKRCFPETLEGSFRVIVAGSWFPRSIFGRCIALCAAVRCVLLALTIAWRGCLPADPPAPASPLSRGASPPPSQRPSSSQRLHAPPSPPPPPRWAPYDAALVDQVAAAVPVLRWAAPGCSVLFYCHFPDQLLAPRGGGRLRALYRALLDGAEERATGAAHCVLVNSAFTKRVFAATFRRLHARGLRPRVLHPAAAVPEEAELQAAQRGWRRALEPGLVRGLGGDSGMLDPPAVFLSINRYERKKNVRLAILALAELSKAAKKLRAGGAPPARRRQRASEGNLAGMAARLVGQPGARAERLARAAELAERSVLVVAGGCDARLPENRAVREELGALARDKGVAERVFFLESFTDAERQALLAACRAVVYTPSEEHFGIVPLEAGAAGRPVIACASGGPLETVVHGVTGALCEPSPPAFAAAMAELLDDRVAERRGKAARAHVAVTFSRTAFGSRLESVLLGMIKDRRKRD